jgi:hypothetical protein
MRPTTQVASMMLETAVLTPTPITALTVFVTIKKIVLLDLPPLLLETVSVMMGQIMLTAIMMVEIVVDMTSIRMSALIVHAI